MAKVKGIVEICMTNKFDSEKIAVKLEGDDTWYNQKKEWLDIVPNRGDEIEFDNGGAKYLKYLKVLSSGTAPKAPTPKGGQGGAKNDDYLIGVQLGHAASNATNIAIAQLGKAVTIEAIEELTAEFYNMMKGVRERFEDKPASKPKVAPAPKIEADVDPFDDSDIPF